MLEILKGFPEDTLAVEWKGHATTEDYKVVFEPAALEKKERQAKMRLFAKLGPEFHSLNPAAAMEDIKVRLSHWDDFSRVAVVSDVGWVRNAVQFFAPFFHAPVRVFADKDAEKARVWLSRRDAGRPF